MISQPSHIVMPDEEDIFKQVSAVAPPLLSTDLRISQEDVDMTPAPIASDVPMAIDGDTNATTSTVNDGPLTPSGDNRITLQTLPFDIRRKIFKKLLDHPARPVLLLPFRTHRLHAQVLRVCKSFYLDAAPIFYGSNVFRLSFARAMPHSEELEIWLPRPPSEEVMEKLEQWRDDQIPGPHLSLSQYGELLAPGKQFIKKVSIGMELSCNWSYMLGALDELEGLEEVYLEFEEWMDFDDPAYTEQERKESVQHTLDTRAEHDWMANVIYQLVHLHGVRIWIVLSVLKDRNPLMPLRYEGSRWSKSDLSTFVVQPPPVDIYHYWELDAFLDFAIPVIVIHSMQDHELPQPVERMTMASRS